MLFIHRVRLSANHHRIHPAHKITARNRSSQQQNESIDHQSISQKTPPGKKNMSPFSRHFWVDDVPFSPRWDMLGPWRLLILSRKNNLCFRTSPGSHSLRRPKADPYIASGFKSTNHSCGFMPLWMDKIAKKNQPGIAKPPWNIWESKGTIPPSQETRPY